MKELFAKIITHLIFTLEEVLLRFCGPLEYTIYMRVQKKAADQMSGALSVLDSFLK